MYKSRGSGQRLWLSQIPGRAKSRLRPKVGPGLARLFLAWLGLASGLRPKPAHHYRIAYDSHSKLLESYLAVDRNVVKGCLTTTKRALMKRTTENHTEWNNPFLLNFLKWCESEWGNGRLERPLSGLKTLNVISGAVLGLSQSFTRLDVFLLVCALKS